MSERTPISEKIPRLRQRRRSDGTWRLWWEAEAAVRELGFQSIELDASRLTWSEREAKRLNAEVARARKGEAQPRLSGRGRTMSDLIERYRRSSRFNRLREKTKRDYTTKLRTIDEKFGRFPVADFTKGIVHEWYETVYNQGKRTWAKALVTQASVLFAYAEILGWRPENSNPCSRLGLEIPPPRKRTAGWPELDALVAAADRCGLPSIGTAVLASLFQGQRQTDVRGIRRRAFRQIDVLDLKAKVQKPVWIFEFVRAKRGNEGQLPVHDEFLARIGEWLRTVNDPDTLLLFDERTGQPYAEDEDLFQRRWREVRKAAAAAGCPSVASLQFRDLRRTFGALARAGGASKSDTADVLGNSAATNPRLGETYMAPQFHTASRAVHAVQRPKAQERKKA